jgi:hypothetical protein
VHRGALLVAVTGALLASGCDRAGHKPEAQSPIVDSRKGAVVQNVGETPMAERVAVIGLLNKRNGIVRNLTMKPGQSLRVRDAIVRLRACETTAPWESPPLTGAFVQLDVEQVNKSWKRVFSGWLYKESPSLNVVEHPVYDVWPKSCTMSWPGAPGGPGAPAKGPIAAGAGTAGQAASKPSSAKKSGTTEAAAPSPAAVTPAPSIEPDASAEPSNRT